MKKRKAAVLAAAAFAMTAAFFLNGIRRAEAADNVVVMLDPGHDSTHTGAAAYGLKEQQLNLKIGHMIPLRVRLKAVQPNRT